MDAKDGWIPHDGGECPIPWAKAGEFEVRLRCGDVCSTFHAVGDLGYHWGRNPADIAGDIMAYRILKPKQEAVVKPFWNHSAQAWTLVDRSQTPTIGEYEFTPAETAQQKLTREASTAYFEKHFAKQAPVRPLGEDAINDIAAAALRAFDAELERKRG